MSVSALSQLQRAGDIYRFPLARSGEPTRLTAVNADMLEGKTLGEQEEIWFEAEDGSMAHGWIVRPPILILT